MANNNLDSEIHDELMTAIKIELDHIVTREVCDSVYEVEKQKGKSNDAIDAECKTRKNAIISVISSSVCLERLYFIIRSSIMGIITGLLTYAVISIFQITNFLTLVTLGVFVFVVSLFISRLFDGPIVKLCNLILKYLNRYQRLREFILSRL